ncbi:MAG: dihydrodipicolinate synthase family protein [Fimbriimonadaceae bacterium]
MLAAGVYPASVTPFDPKGRVDRAAVARLLAFFESEGCRGAVLAGTNGEGPSLSAVEKRDLIQSSLSLRGKLDLVLGIATPSIEEAVWLAKQAVDAKAVLVMPPGYFRTASEEGVAAWFESLLERSPSPVLVYNFPKMTGITLSADLIARLGRHERMIGVKDSSGDRGNLVPYRQALTRSDQSLFVGDETLLIDALDAGWSGTISGLANVMPRMLAAIVDDFRAGNRESARAKFAVAAPAMHELRRFPQPSAHKSVLRRMGILPSGAMRLPLLEATPDTVEEELRILRESVGIAP